MNVIDRRQNCLRTIEIVVMTWAFVPVAKRFNAWSLLDGESAQQRAFRRTYRKGNSAEHCWTSQQWHSARIKAAAPSLERATSDLIVWAEPQGAPVR